MAEQIVASDAAYVGQIHYYWHRSVLHENVVQVAGGGAPELRR
ncbi:MAG: hypothetical protein ACREBU_11835 [Nitrososphaera sp.]